MSSEQTVRWNRDQSRISGASSSTTPRILFSNSYDGGGEESTLISRERAKSHLFPGLTSALIREPLGGQIVPFQIARGFGFSFVHRSNHSAPSFAGRRSRAVPLPE